MYKIYFYKTLSGREVVTDFIESLDETTKGRVRNGIRVLEEHGLELLRNRSVKKIARKPDIYELRTVGEIQVRIFFVIYDSESLLLLHIFVKKTQMTPIKEIRLAQKRAKEFI